MGGMSSAMSWFLRVVLSDGGTDAWPCDEGEKDAGGNDVRAACLAEAQQDERRSTSPEQLIFEIPLTAAFSLALAPKREKRHEEASRQTFTRGLQTLSRLILVLSTRDFIFYWTQISCLPVPG
ncbi:hypothetical protein NDU88_003494 [Pleurodeles waltl]|uniref:Uncharacterized protein n=1 Tax=Pleurodeles waltl TaxID=8319 RepID=A0AAV7T545_PLEWA|nr:hypothetical protein NDU88_003494 [Pleurodeles waltl]